MIFRQGNRYWTALGLLPLAALLVAVTRRAGGTARCDLSAPSAGPYLAPAPTPVVSTLAQLMRLGAETQQQQGLAVPDVTQLTSEKWWPFMLGRSVRTLRGSLAIFPEAYQYTATIGKATPRVSMDRAALQLTRLNSWNQGTRDAVLNPVFADVRTDSRLNVMPAFEVTFSGLSWHGDWSMTLRVRRDSMLASSTDALTLFDPSSETVVIERLTVTIGKSQRKPYRDVTVVAGQFPQINYNIGDWCGGGNNGLNNVQVVKTLDASTNTTALAIRFKMYSYGAFGAPTGCHDGVRDIFIQSGRSFPALRLQNAPSPQTNRQLFETWGGMDTTLFRGTSLAAYYYDSLTPSVRDNPKKDSNFPDGTKSYFQGSIGVFTNLFLQGYSPGSPAVTLAAALELAANPWRWDSTRSARCDAALPPVTRRNRPLNGASRRSRVAVALNLVLQTMAAWPDLVSAAARDQVLQLFSSAIGYDIKWRSAVPAHGDRDFSKWALSLTALQSASADDWLCDAAVTARAMTQLLTMFPTPGGSAFSDVDWAPVVLAGAPPVALDKSGQGQSVLGTQVYFLPGVLKQAPLEALKPTLEEKQSFLVPLSRLAFNYTARPSQTPANDVAWLKNPVPHTWDSGAGQWLLQPYSQVRYVVGGTQYDQDLAGLPDAPNDARPGYVNLDTKKAGQDIYVLSQGTLTAILEDAQAQVLEPAAQVSQKPPRQQRAKDVSLQAQLLALLANAEESLGQGWPQSEQKVVDQWGLGLGWGASQSGTVDPSEAAAHLSSQYARTASTQGFRSAGNAYYAAYQGAETGARVL